MKHTFTVRETDESTVKHEIEVTIPSFEEASEAQKAVMYDAAVSAVTVRVQNPLRTAIGKGLRGKDLNSEAQKRFDAAINGQRARSAATVVDAKALKLDAKQIAGLRAAGATVINAD